MRVLKQQNQIGRGRQLVRQGRSLVGRGRRVGQAANGQFAGDVDFIDASGRTVSANFAGENLLDPNQQYDKESGNELAYARVVEDDGEQMGLTVLELDGDGDGQPDTSIIIAQEQQQAPVDDQCTVPVSNMTFQRRTDIITGAKQIVSVDTDVCGNTVGFVEQVQKTAVTGPWAPVNGVSEVAGLPFSQYSGEQWGLEGPLAAPFVNSPGLQNAEGYQQTYDGRVGRGQRRRQVGSVQHRQNNSTLATTQHFMRKTHRGA